MFMSVDVNRSTFLFLFFFVIFFLYILKHYWTFHYNLTLKIISSTGTGTFLINLRQTFPISMSIHHFAPGMLGT